MRHHIISALAKEEVLRYRRQLPQKNFLFKLIYYYFIKHTVVVPGNRPDWAENALDAADHCKFVKFVVVISLIISPLDSFFGCNYNDIELEAKVSLFRHCFVDRGDA